MYCQSSTQREPPVALHAHTSNQIHQQAQHAILPWPVLYTMDPWSYSIPYSYLTMDRIPYHRPILYLMIIWSCLSMVPYYMVLPIAMVLPCQVLPWHGPTLPRSYILINTILPYHGFTLTGPTLPWCYLARSYTLPRSYPNCHGLSQPWSYRVLPYTAHKNRPLCSEFVIKFVCNLVPIIVGPHKV